MSGDGMQSFITALTTGLDADAVWTAIAPIAGLIVVACIVGITRRLINKNLGSITRGSAGKAK